MNPTCERSNCRKRHPNNCRYFALNNFCKFNEDCAFMHKKPDDLENESTKEEIKSLKVEVRSLKAIIGQIVSNKLEEDQLKKKIKFLKTEIESLRDLNRDMDYRIRLLEEENESEEDDEEFQDDCELDGMYTCRYCGNEFGVEKYFKDHIKRHETEAVKVAYENNELIETNPRDKENILTLEELYEEYVEGNDPDNVQEESFKGAISESK